ncbi:MAG: NAD(P)-binding protein [Deltaproteobacteria bacterium]|nr:NAD(P)-binding protein [Deltaproteobacteria bacterium]
MLTTDVLIIGAGPSGLSTSYFLQIPKIVIIEKEDRAGGLMKTDYYEDSYFDKTGHLLHLRTDELRRIIENELNVPLRRIKRNSKIFSRDTFIEYPFQVNLYGLPKEVVATCLKNFIHAKIKKRKKRYKSFKDFIYGEFGEGIANEFLIPYNTKIWTLNPDDMSAGFCEKYIPVPDIDDVIDGALGIIKTDVGYNASFYYPERGGIESIIRGFLRRIHSEIIYKSYPVKINLKKRLVFLSNNTVYNYKYLVSTIPLNDFISLIEDAPVEIQNAGSRLSNTEICYFNVITKRILDNVPHWIYLPERDIPFYRVGSYSAFNRLLTRDEYETFYIEFSYRKGGFCDSGNLERRIPHLFKRLGFIKDDSDIISIRPFFIKCAYVIFDKHYQKSTSLIFDYLSKNRVYSIGRYGKWEYSSMQDAILYGKETALDIKKRIKIEKNK